ncbi:hypothetical protein [Streptomyces sp. NPDC052496]|uniref:hypothetical protein n=1 Tax=Streptomyces sp. NPDC052496 TaxID=3154951 RepID=UPI0034148836
MNDRTSSLTLNRLRAVTWMGDWDHAFGHVMSRRILLREYMRRAALWAQAYSADSEWPFFDVTPYVDAEFHLPTGLAAHLEEYLSGVPTGAVRRTCSGAVRLNELRRRSPSATPDLPDLYEPLILFYERGGEFVRDNAGFLDLTGVLFKPGPLQGHLRSPALSTLDDTVLDAVDANGRITYYAAVGDGAPLLRRRKLRNAQRDESFGKNLRWEPTDRITAAEEKGSDASLVEIDEIEAANLLGTFTAGATR